MGEQLLPMPSEADSAGGCVSESSCGASASPTPAVEAVCYRAYCCRCLPGAAGSVLSKSGHPSSPRLAGVQTNGVAGRPQPVQPAPALSGPHPVGGLRPGVTPTLAVALAYTPPRCQRQPMRGAVAPKGPTPLHAAPRRRCPVSMRREGHDELGRLLPAPRRLTPTHSHSFHPFGCTVRRPAMLL
eukprot:scaffold1653_cov389-Prasinococcus_capsulatus_cf.AAC.2